MASIIFTPIMQCTAVSPKNVNAQKLNPVQVNLPNLDVFQSQQATLSTGSNISFGSARRVLLLDVINHYSRQVEKLETPAEISKCINNYFSELKDSLQLFERPSKKKNKVTNKLWNPIKKIFLKEKHDFTGIFGHELIGGQSAHSQIYADGSEDMREFLAEIHPSSVTEEGYLALQKSEFKKMFKFASDCVNRYEHLENWANHPRMKVNADEVFEAVEQSYNSAASKIGFLRSLPTPIVKGRELLQGQKIKNPFRDYNIESQLWLNALKYGEGKQIEVEIAKNINTKKGGLLFSVTNTETDALSNAQIIELIKGEGFRVDKPGSRTRGTGKGISEVVKNLKESGHKKDIQTLFEPDRKNGVRVIVPIVGLQ